MATRCAVGGWSQSRDGSGKRAKRTTFAGVAVMWLRLLTLAVAFVAVPSHAKDQEGYRIGAWYMPTWRADVESLHIRQSAKIYGRQDPWGGIRDYAGGHGRYPTGMGETDSQADFSGRKPKLGFYDLRQSGVIQEQIRQAKTGGLAFFSFYWYWDSDTQRELYDTAWRFLEADVARSLTYVLAGITISKKPISLLEWRSRIVPVLVEKYFAHPNYMRIDGRPVFIDFNLRFDNRGTSDIAYSILRDATKKQLGVEPFLLKRVGKQTNALHLRHFLVQQGFDGLTCFRFPIERPAEPYLVTITRWHRELDSWVSAARNWQGNEVAFVPCGTTAFDARPWYMIGWGPWVKTEFRKPSDRPFNLPAAPGEFSMHLQYLRDILDQHPNLTHKMAILYAWNEWGEGGTIEPSEKNDDALLHTIRDVFWKSPQPASKVLVH